MSSPDERSATTVVIEMKPGWIYVKMAEPKAEPDTIERLLRLTACHWFSTRPQFVTERTQTVIEQGICK